ncbi:MAG: hypothetical protein Q6K90_03100 [Gloeomargarita sp. HHBFW_bins_162]
MVKRPVLYYILRTRKIWLLGLLVVAGMALAVGSGEVLAGHTSWVPVTAWVGLWPLWLTSVPAVAAVALAMKGMGWVPQLEMTLVGQALAAYGLVGAGVVGWLWYRRRSRRPRQV